MKKFRGILIFFSIFFVSQTFAQVLISEVAWMGTVASSYDEWIELYNSGEEEIDLTGWVLKTEDNSPNINLNGQISAKSYFLLERTDDTSVSNIPADQIYTGSLKNSGETLILKNSDEEIVDQTPEGNWAAGENPAKKSMERVDYTSSGISASIWQTFQNETSDFLDTQENIILGSPKAQNSGNPTFPIPANLEFVSHFDSIEITKIKPVPLDSGEIWFEFTINSDSAVDITDWEIKNTNNSQKLSELADNLVLISDSENLAGNLVHLNENGWEKIDEQNLPNNYTLPVDRLIFSAKNVGDPIIFAIKSAPLPLSDNKEFKITNIDQEIASNVFASNLQILLSEISPNRDTPNPKEDFFELFIKSAAANTDLQFLEIKHNGKRLFFAENSLLVQTGDILTFQLLFNKIQERPKKYRNTTFLQETGDSYVWEKGSKNGIIATSGTMEIILWSGTSWEKNSEDNGETADFVCWMKTKLNKTETNRLAKNKPQNWGGDCIKIEKLAKNESIARTEPQTDNNNSNDFYRHYHGSPGELNFIKNQKPHARIKLQSGKFEGKAKVNFTGLEKDNSASYDGDGYKDLVKFQWKINGEVCGDYEAYGWNWDNENCYLESQKKNPSYLYFNFEEYEKFEISLKVTDLAGFSDTNKITISREKLEIKETESDFKEFNYDEKPINESFFAEFLAKTDIEKLKKIAYTEIQPEPITPTPQYLFARDKFTAEEKSRIAKNIGLIFQ